MDNMKIRRGRQKILFVKCALIVKNSGLPVFRKPLFCRFYKSDRRGSNPRSRPWQGRALPTTPLSHFLNRNEVEIPLSNRQILLYNKDAKMSIPFF